MATKNNRTIATNESTGDELDEGLYSRQIYTYGVEAMKKMKDARILFSTLNGLGLEAAKNVALGGVNSITLHDTECVKMDELSSLYYATEKDVGKNRAEVCFPRLAELNPHVKTDVYTGELTEEFLKNFTIVVLCNTPLDELVRVNDICRKYKIKFISSDTFGLVGKVFCDFGEEHLVNDLTGEEAHTGIIENITNDAFAKVTCIKPHNMTNSDYIKFIEIDGLDGIEEKEFQIKYVDRTTFTVNFDATSLGKFVSGEYLQVKHPSTLSYKSLKDSMESPEYIITDFAHFERPAELHACYLALNEMTMKNEQITFESFFEKVKLFNADANEETIQMFMHVYKGNVCPMQAVIGGITAQEVMKASSHKYTPINQWLYFDRFDCLPENYKELNTKDQGTRYDGQVRIFGQELMEKFRNQRFFVVGSGAIGCEHLKNFAMMGLATGEKGHMYVTDMDIIERSNLNRQFLFRNKDIGNSKSTSGLGAVKEMNPQVNGTAHENRVGVETEGVYNREFYQTLDFVANALDNIKARLYMDGQCVLHGIPLLESGTLGTKGNIQVVVPHLTESYGSSQDPPETGIPVCTLKNFPYEIAHTIQWSRDMFEGLFDQAPRNALDYLQHPEKITDLQSGDLIIAAKNIEWVLKNTPNSFEDCIRVGFDFWHDQYKNQIEQLLYKFPPGYRTSTGDPFWAGSKKCPHPLTFNVEDDGHLDYVCAFANLWADVFGVERETNREVVQKFVMGLTPPEFSVDKNAKISVTEEEEKEKVKSLADAITPEDVINSLPDISKYTNLKITPLEFEKDDDTNFHIDFITAASNMRASNYKIKHANKLKTKGIAGKIIPAIATTTSVVSGLICLELYKIMQEVDDLEKYNNGFINLALSYFGFSDPMAPLVTEFRGKKFTMWEHFEVKGDMTLRQFLDYFKETYGYVIEFINYNEFMIYATYVFPEEEIKKRMETKICDIIEENLDIRIKDDMILLTIDVELEESEELDDDDLEGIDIPQVKYFID